MHAHTHTYIVDLSVCLCVCVVRGGSYQSEEGEDDHLTSSSMYARTLIHTQVMDVLLYMNPTYRQRILKAVGERLNSLYHRFMHIHPNYK